MQSYLFHVGDAYSPSLLSTIDKGTSTLEMLVLWQSTIWFSETTNSILVLRMLGNEFRSQTFLLW